MTAQNIKFEVGKTYYCRSVCDYNCIWNVQVISRTEKTMIISVGGKTSRVKIRIHNNIENALPLGRYSMAPVVSADRISA